MTTPQSPADIEFLGRAESFLHFMEELARVAALDRPVLIVGERGAGKELAAARLHYLSPRWQGPFVILDCGALAPSLMESELFGHEAGAFTGAVTRRMGRFEAADRGSLFLDELASMPMPLQQKILRATEYGGFQRLGASGVTTVDTRIIAATNRDLPAMARAGRFKPDLLDRLSFEVLTLPPLRAREEDIPLLAARFAAGMYTELGWETPPAPFEDAALAKLVAHHWPGNVRELKNVVERAAARCEGGRIRPEDVVLDPFASPYRAKASVAPPHVEGEASDLQREMTTAWSNTADDAEGSLQGPEHMDKPPERPAEGRLVPAGPESLPMDLRHALRVYEREALARALRATQGNQRRAAALLGLSYDQFRGLYRKHFREDR